MLFCNTENSTTGESVPFRNQVRCKSKPLTVICTRFTLQKRAWKYHWFLMSLGGLIFSFLYLRPRGRLLSEGITTWCRLRSITAGWDLRWENWFTIMGLLL